MNILIKEIGDILQPDKQEKFSLLENDVFSRPATNSTFWFKMTVKNRCDDDAWLDVGSTYAWYIDFYAPDSSGGYKKPIYTGTMSPEENKPIDVNTFWLPLNEANDSVSKTFYVRVKSGLTYELPIYVGTIRPLSKNKKL